MKITNEKLNAIKIILDAVVEHDTKTPIKMDSGLRYNIARNLDHVNRALKPFQTVRNELIKRHGDEEGGEYTVKAGTEGYKEFLAALEPVIKEEQEVDLRLLHEEPLIKAELPIRILTALMELELIKA